MQVVSECHVAWRNLVGKAELGEISNNLSVSRLSDLASDIDPESVINGYEGEDGEEELAAGEDGEYPTSLIAWGQQRLILVFIGDPFGLRTSISRILSAERHAFFCVRFVCCYRIATCCDRFPVYECDPEYFDF